MIRRTIDLPLNKHVHGLESMHGAERVEEFDDTALRTGQVSPLVLLREGFADLAWLFHCDDLESQSLQGSLGLPSKRGQRATELEVDLASQSHRFQRRQLRQDNIELKGGEIPQLSVFAFKSDFFDVFLHI